MEKEGMPANKDQQEKKATPSPPKEASPRSHPYFGPGSASPHPPPSGPYPPRYDATATAAFAHMNHPHMYHSPHRPANGNGANRQLNGTNSSSKTDRNWNQQQQGKQQAAGSPPPMPKPPHPHAMFPPYDPKLWAERGGYAPFHYPYGPWAMMAEQNREMQPLKLPPKKKKSPDKEARATSPTEIDNIHKEDVQHMGCTCKRTKCLKLYCQCFGIKIHCGSNCRCTECHNTTEYEQERKDAMRSILSRNPSAFDSKFKADKLTEDQKLLLHKTGCKCRKSNCMKKYCECFAGSVHCTKNCRCVGCKNVGPNGLGAASADLKTPPRNSTARTLLPQAKSAPPKFVSKAKAESDHIAAKSLTFLKRSTPEVKTRRKPDMPSLASSSEGTSPDKDDAMSSLMLAAYAMTEFSNSDSPKKRLKFDNAEDSLMAISEHRPAAPHST